MGFFTLAVASGGFLLIGMWEALDSSYSNRDSNQSSALSAVQGPTQSSVKRMKTGPSSSSLSYVSILVLSFLVILNSLVSCFDALSSKDRIGLSLQLQVLAVSSLFLLYSIAGLSVNLTNSIRLSPSILSLIALFAFIEEFLLFYLQKKDTSGIENRYFDLLLVPITVCVFSTILEVKSPDSNYPKLARGIGLILQGTWFLQMGFSFYTSMVAQGCSLHEKSRGNYTVKCKGHSEYHRARAIATLQFNCHLAFLVATVVGVYSIMARRIGGDVDFTRYRPLGAEMQPFENQGQFTLDSDEEVIGEIMEESNVVTQKDPVVEVGVNGHH